MSEQFEEEKYEEIQSPVMCRELKDEIKSQDKRGFFSSKVITNSTTKRSLSTDKMDKTRNERSISKGKRKAQAMQSM